MGGKASSGSQSRRLCYHTPVVPLPSSDLVMRFVGAAHDADLRLELNTIYDADESPWKVSAYRFHMIVGDDRAGTISLRLSTGEPAPSARCRPWPPSALADLQPSKRAFPARDGMAGRDARTSKRWTFRPTTTPMRQASARRSSTGSILLAGAAPSAGSPL